MDVKIEKRDDLKVFATLDNASSLKKELEFKDPRFSSFSVFRSYSSFSRVFFLTQRCINLSWELGSLQVIRGAKRSLEFVSVLNKIDS